MNNVRHFMPNMYKKCILFLGSAIIDLTKGGYYYGNYNYTRTARGKNI